MLMRLLLSLRGWWSRRGRGRQFQIFVGFELKVFAMFQTSGKLNIAFFFFVSISLSAPTSGVPTKQIVDANAVKNEIKSLSNEELSFRLNSDGKSDNPNFCVISLLLGEALSRKTLPNAIRQAKDAADLQCAVVEQRWAVAYKMLLLFEKSSQQSLGKYGFDIARIAGQNVAAVERLERMAAAQDEKDFLTISLQQIFELFRSLGKEGKKKDQERMFNAIYKSPHFSKLHPDDQSSVASTLLDLELGKTKSSEVARYIELFSTIYAFQDKLTNRKYEKLWPELERAAGSNMTIVAEKNVRNALKHYEADKNNRNAFQRAVHALHFAGKFEEAITLAQTFDHKPDSILAMTEDDAWALNAEAYAFDALGKTSDAGRVFDLIVSIPYSPEKNGWLVNFAINRALRLVELGKWQQGYDAAVFAGTVAEKSGSSYAKMLVKQAKGCALVNLDRRKEAAAIVDEMFVARKDAYAAAAAALLCLGDDDRAAKTVIDALDDKEGNGDMINDMQKKEFQIFYSRSALPRIRERLRERADVKARFEKVARDIPDAMMPVGGVRREKLKG